MTHLVRDAVWWIRDYAYAVAWQVRAFVSRRAPDDYLDGTERPIVVLPGIWETWAFLRPIIDPLHRRGHPMHVLTSLGWNGRPVARTAEDVAAYLAEHDLHDVVIVAHSKGGLIGKTMMVSTDRDGRLARMVTVNSPFSGTRWSLYLPNRTLKAFSPRDADLLRLADQLEANSRITSMASGFDAHVTEGSVLPGATNVTFPVDGHFRPLGNPECIDMVVAAVEHWPDAAAHDAG